MSIVFGDYTPVKRTQTVTGGKFKCSRCKITTSDENKMIKHVLEKLCAYNAQYYKVMK